MMIPSSIGALIDLFGFASWIFYGMVFSSLLYLRYKSPNANRPYKVRIHLVAFSNFKRFSLPSQSKIPTFGQIKMREVLDQMKKPYRKDWSLPCCKITTFVRCPCSCPFNEYPTHDALALVPLMNVLCTIPLLLTL